MTYITLNEISWIIIWLSTFIYLRLDWKVQGTFIHCTSGFNRQQWSTFFFCYYYYYYYYYIYLFFDKVVAKSKTGIFVEKFYKTWKIICVVNTEPNFFLANHNIQFMKIFWDLKLGYCFFKECTEFIFRLKTFRHTNLYHQTLHHFLYLFLGKHWHFFVRELSLAIPFLFYFLCCLSPCSKMLLYLYHGGIWCHLEKN